ncbi:VCBS repeat-containing protein [Mucilaginibacter sp. SMC90]|uniref:FG-GAP repeat domain-containing protein n=1 Tax=Mucilaginibacter sp. SMC90 TaxID=2929803 RepID=UPI001FB2AA48|nr:VCBS repeat-containing protein [Mucilaginibacter sp. SMC90]UOE51094.1 VCBS repeat-containing protein [Mucilaginibacter sp. SMC90]
MKICFLTVCLLIAVAQSGLSQQNARTPKHKKGGNDINGFLHFDHSMLLEEKADTTANVSLGDLDGDGHLDILLVKGRHWPIHDRVLLGDGTGKIRKAYNLGNISDRSYTGALADFNGDGSLDIAVSNDDPDHKIIYFNDGKGNFKVASEFGRPEWSTRNISIADINRDGLPDIILANRGESKTSNYICLNTGKGQFGSNCIPFAPYPTTTITPADFNNDGFIDLVAPHRDGGQSYIYFGSSDMSYSDAHRVPFGPPDATIRMAAVADFNSDKLLDIVTIDENKGVYLYLGQKDQTFSEGISLADRKIVPYALTIADLNNDKKIDIIVGHIEAPSTIFYNEGTGHFKPVTFGDSKGTVYGFAIGDFNEDGTPDIAAARSDAPNILYFGNTTLKSRK